MIESITSIGIFIDATARLLREEACKHIELSEIAIEDKDLIKKICRSKQKR